MTLQLPFQQEIFTQLLEKDGMLVLARGLGLERCITSFLQLAAERYTLVILLNATSEQEERFSKALQAANEPKTTLHVIKNDVKAEDRVVAYRRGGLLSVTSRIFVVDMLKKRVPIQLITGILVVNAHRVTQYSLEAFILRLYRQENSDGFIKAFTDSPETFGYGFCPLEKTLKALQLRTVHLWPRFHVTIKASLDTSEHVVELRQPMTKQMIQIQGAIIDCIEACLSDLKRAHPSLDGEQFTLENALLRSFDMIARQQLDPIWHQVSARTKQLIGDLRLLRQLLSYLINYDCVTFNTLLDTLIWSFASQRGGNIHQLTNQPSPWMLLDAADVLFSTARDRVYRRTGATDTERVQANEVDHVLKNATIVLEEQPKWKLLCETLLNIKNEKTGQDLETILIMVEDIHTVKQLQKYFINFKALTQEDAGKKLLRNELVKYLTWRKSLSSMSITTVAETGTRTCDTSSFASRGRQPPSKRRRVRGASTAVPASGTTHADLAGQPGSNTVASIIATLPEHPSQDGAIEVVEVGLPIQVDEQLIAFIHLYSDGAGDTLLEELSPKHIIMYEPNPTFVRQVEVYRALHPDTKIDVYFMMYEDSVEEQRYLSMIRREKASFEKLIHEKSSMSIPLPAKKQPGIQSEEDLFVRVYNTRIGGSARVAPADETPKVIVDMREFRSSLPSMLHEKGFEIVPCTLIVGDYVLSPNICVERKSVADLIGSLNSGRLYAQSEMMCSRYETPILLIEFDQDKAFSLQGVNEISTDISMSSITSKLTLLSLTFPRLRIIWSCGVNATADIFRDLKEKQPEPDEQQAAMVGAEDEDDAKFALDQTAMELLQSLPGINSVNSRIISRHVRNISELCQTSQEQLAEWIGEAPARQLYRFLHNRAQ